MLSVATRTYLKMALAAAGCLGSLIVAGCSSQGAIGLPPAPLSGQFFVDADNGKTVYVSSDDYINITLYDYRASGGHWNVSVMNPAYLTLVSTTIIDPPAGSPPGTSGRIQFRFHTQGNVITPLVLSYTPPLLPPAVSTYALAVVIGNPSLNALPSAITLHQSDAGGTGTVAVGGIAMFSIRYPLQPEPATIQVTVSNPNVLTEITPVAILPDVGTSQTTGTALFVFYAMNPGTSNAALSWTTTGVNPVFQNFSANVTVQ